MPKTKLNQTFAERTSGTEGKDTYYWDTTITGFGLKISASGKKTWFFHRMVRGGGRTQVTLGSFPSMDFNQARLKALEMTGQVEAGESPKTKAQKSAEAVTIEDVFEDYAQKKMAKSSRTNLRLFLDKHIYPKHRKWLVKDFTRGYFIKWIEENYHDQPGTAYNIITYVNAAWNYAITREILPANTYNPAFKVKRALLDSGFKLRKSKNGYKMALEANDITKLIKAIKDSYDDQNINAIATAASELILHTGARRNEIQTLMFDEIDYEKRLITKAEPGKNGLTRYIRLSDTAMELLTRAAEVRKAKNRENGVYVFPSGREGHKHKHITSINTYLKLIGAKADLPDLKPHNLRSLYINIAVDGGVPMAVVAENVGHSNVMTTMLHYIKNKKSALFDGINTVGELLASLTMED
ncbi:site-specific integrase [Magnetospirillum sp. 15-1]|uniref:tyrosine-type recombinase/integrase n=1 Tax=Magnetospirillum sp. 15-1 TaxID=1979370 RepID=UPI000BBC57EE|nr:site-specific integrase [Magnetospirillum sp. 15-1]